MKALEIKFQGRPFPLVHPLDPTLENDNEYNIDNQLIIMIIN